EQSASQKKTYAYDATGNRTQRLTYSLANGSETQTARQTLDYATDSNRLTQRSTSYAVEVDAAGNYTRYSQNRRYRYDDQGRLSTVTDASGVPMASYRYNALGQRTLKLAHSGDIRYPTTYLYGPDGQLLGQVQYSSTGQKKTATYWIWLDDLPLAGIELTYASDGTTLTSNRLYYLHADHLNTPRLATDAHQRLLWSWNSDAFGVGPANPDVDGDGLTTDIPLRFPGQLYDAHSALHYNYFR
ncbi:MAG: RHS repeat protein, partial [Pseudomonas indica]|nr:RHS repeat protein [Pseudomonas indica]